VPQALLTALTSLEHELSRQLTQAAGRGSFGQFVTPYPPPSVPELLLHAKIATAPTPTAESAERIPTLNFIKSSFGERWATAVHGHLTLVSSLGTPPSTVAPARYARPVPSSARMRTSSPSCPNEPLFTRV
jgi:hypothetical protein